METWDGLRILLAQPHRSTDKDLRLEDVDAFITRLGSDEYARQQRTKEMEEAKALQQGQLLLDRALAQGLIPRSTYYRLMASMYCNGRLLVSPQMAQCLAQVRYEEEGVDDGSAIS